MIRNRPKCSVCHSTKHTKRTCPKLAPEPKQSERIALTATVASQARTIEGLVHIVTTLGKPVVFETKGRVFMPAPPAPKLEDDAAHRAVQRLLFAMHVYPGYSVSSRGPAGCILDAIALLEPATAAKLSDADPGNLLDPDPEIDSDERSLDTSGNVK